jgi:MscS family membrane protein
MPANVLAQAQQALLRLDLADWLGTCVAFALALVAAGLVAMVVLRALGAMTRRTPSLFDDRLLRTAAGPLRVALFALFFSLARRPIELSKASTALFATLESSLLVIAGSWQVLRVLDLLADDYRARFQRRGQGQAGSTLVLVHRCAKIAALGIAAIMVLDNAGVHVTALLAGVGLGGIAIALAAQKSIENLFGGITLYLDRPVRVGQFCRFGERFGEVEEIGLRSTRVRTPDRTLVTVPNAEFANLQLENFGLRDKIWFHPTLMLRSNTPPDRLREILAALRELLAKREAIERDSARVRVVGFGAYSINLEISAYVLTRSLDEYFAIAEELYLAVVDVLAEHQSGIAFSAPAEFK